MKRSKDHKLIQVICALVLCLCLGTVVCGAAESGKQDTAQDQSEDYILNEDLADVGITMNLPAAFGDLKGMTYFQGMDVSDGTGIYFGNGSYIGATREEYQALAAKDAPTEKELQEFQNKVRPLFSIIIIDENRGAEDIVDFINEDNPEEPLTADQLTLLAKEGDCSFFEYTGKLYEGDPHEGLREEFAKEYDALASLKDEVVKNMKFSPVKRAFSDLIGSRVSFETKDLDGRTVSSEEIFSQHEITMVNVWATWCHWCVNELPELEKISGRLAEKDCAVIGLCGDAENDETIAKAKGLLAENGDTYLNLRPWDGWMDIFDMSQGWPMTFFVDREGTIVGRPVVGADINAYEPRVDALLKGEDQADAQTQEKDGKEAEDKADAAGTANTAKPADESGKGTAGAYNIYVVDQNAQPVEGAMVQFCTNDTCKMALTDADGLASFTDPEGIYDVHVLKVPEGYEKDNEAYKTANTYGDLVITINKK